ncbi:uncharacterized protein KY384_006136 [Bacidia gigantensis]|uniref:uncharacterized protein n=1 Tax=Bacidia gigantensis TaxID=2732470 RepID=UPI001D04A4C2|nr:uncharacterized protein KY384_006136 [Bacidia gigantensis]KAG8529499.1 hypothetical protein KY384_006136 [Bacidia gigantensis]
MYLSFSVCLSILSFSALTSALPADSNGTTNVTTSSPKNDDDKPHFTCPDKVTTAFPDANDCQNALLQLGMDTIEQTLHQGDLSKTVGYGRCQVDISLVEGAAEQSDIYTTLGLQVIVTQLILNCAKLASASGGAKPRTGGSVVTGRNNMIQIGFTKLPKNVTPGFGEPDDGAADAEGSGGQNETVAFPGLATS